MIPRHQTKRTRERTSRLLASLPIRFSLRERSIGGLGGLAEEELPASGNHRSFPYEVSS